MQTPFVSYRQTIERLDGENKKMSQQFYTIPCETAREKT
jgi:hypothetical protein